MRSILATRHRVIDFITVLGFVLAPAALDLAGLAARLAYILAGIHLALTLLTRFAPTGRRPVSLGVHGAVECIVGIALMALPWLLKWSGTARSFYMVAGAIILLVWALSQYQAPARRAAV